MSAAPAAPEILVIADLLIGLVFLLAFLVLLGILWTYRHTFGWLLGKLAAISVRIPLIGVRIHPFFLAGDFDHAFQAIISAGAAKTQAMSGRFFHAAAVVQGWIVRELKDFAVEVWSWMNWLQKAHLPRWLKALIYAAVPPLLLPRILKAIGHIDIPALYRRVRNIEQGLQHEVVGWIKKYAKYAVPFVDVIPGLRQEIFGLTKRNAKINARLRKLELRFAIPAFAATMAYVLGLGTNWRCLTRGNIGKVSRALCGLGPRALEDLLGLIADVLILQNICTVIGYLEDGLSLIEPELTAFIATAEKQFVHCKYELTANNTVAAPDVPPLTGLTLNPV